jgi:hypothetical protein
VKDAGAQALPSRVCVRYEGTVGGEWPTPQRGHWFSRQGDVHALRVKLRMLCPLNTELLSRASSVHKYTYMHNAQTCVHAYVPLARQPSPQTHAHVHMETAYTLRHRLVAYQRDLTRKIANLDEALRSIVSKLNQSANGVSWDVRVVIHDQQRSPCELAHILSSADVLLTPHGFQSMLLLFMPLTSLIFEVYPYKVHMDTPLHNTCIRVIIYKTHAYPRAVL